MYAGSKRRESNSKYMREAYISEQSLIALKLVITENLQTS